MAHMEKGGQCYFISPNSIQVFWYGKKLRCPYTVRIYGNKRNVTSENDACIIEINK